MTQTTNYKLQTTNCDYQISDLKQKSPVLYLLWLLAFCLFLSSCATPAYKRVPLKYSPADYVTIDDFCSRYFFRYDFDTLDDSVRLHSQENEIRLLLNSNAGYFNGRIIYLKRPPIYRRGTILVSRELTEIISSQEAAPLKPLFAIKTVVIDPGHGGRDPGAISARGMKEKNLNLKIAKYLKRELKRKGFKVVLTRRRDISLSLKERIAVARRQQADLFLSIHTNSNRSSALKGIEVYYLSPLRFNPRERAVRLAKGKEFKRAPFDTRVILWDMLLTKNYRLSLETAHALYFSFKDVGLKVKPPKKANFYVLRYAYVPSVLVEVGYLSNRREERILRKKYYQRQLAETIASGIVSLKRRGRRARRRKENVALRDE